MKNFSNKYAVCGSSALSLENRHDRATECSCKIVSFPAIRDYAHAELGAERVSDRKDIKAGKGESRPARRAETRVSTRLANGGTTSRTYVANSDYSKAEAAVLSLIGVAVSFFFVLI